MSGSRWKPLPSSLPEPAREFAERQRALLDDAGLSLRRLAADDEVHYSVTALHRFFSGQAIPPRQLVDVLARRSGVDPSELHELYELLSGSGPRPARTGRPPRTAARSSGPARSRTLPAGCAGVGRSCAGIGPARSVPRCSSPGWSPESW